MTGQQIKELRKQLNLSQKDFAEKIGVKRLTIARWESGERTPDEINQKRLLQIGKENGLDTTPQKFVSSEQGNVSSEVDTLDTKTENVSNKVDTKKGGDTKDGVTDDTLSVSKNIVETALELARSGVSIVSTDAEKIPTTKWKNFQACIATEAEIKAMFNNPKAQGVATIGGAVSDGLEILDFDYHKNAGIKGDFAGNLYPEWKEFVISQFPELFQKLVIISTPKSGYQARYRYEADKFEGNQKLVEAYEINPETSEVILDEHGKQKKVALIETRGEGGYALCPPSPKYKMIQGDLLNIPTITKAERDFLIKVAKSFHAIPNDVKIQVQPTDLRPGDDFNQHGNHRDLLEKHNWTLALERNGVEYWRRPGKEGNGWSATWNAIPNRFYVFSTNASPLEDEKTYDLFALYTFLEHDGTFQVAAKTLASEGYGNGKIELSVENATKQELEQRKVTPQNIMGEINLLNEPTPEKIQTKLWDFVTDASYWTPTELGRFCDKLNIEYNLTKTWLRGWKRAVITEKRQRSAQEQSFAATDDGDKPTISVSNRFMREITDDIISAINRVNSLKPFIFVRSGLPTRIELDENGNAIAKPLTVAATRGIMERAANFVSETDIEGESLQIPVNPPLDNVNDFLSLGYFPDLPPLVGICTAPIVAHDGTICTEEGYQPKTRYFYHAKPKIEIGDLTPSTENVEKAKRLILDEILCDFPFADHASRANLIALMLTPFVRPLIQGATPLHTIDASTPGTGKSLLADITSMPFIPFGPTIMTAGKDDDEWRKRITAKLMSAPSHILIDNVKQKLSSEDLAAALTAHEWEDRILGQSATIRLPVKCTWIATGNNLELSDEIARRSVWIRLETNVERPWERRGFKHEDLRGWVRRHRGEIITALLTLIQKWLADGKPEENDVILGGYEEWVKVIGGILQAIGIDGFLENATELYDQLDVERQAWVAFVNAWAEKYGAYDKEFNHWGVYVETDTGARVWKEKDSGEFVGTKELFPLASHLDDNQNKELGILDAYLGKGKERARKVNLGRELQKRKGRVFDGYKLEILSTKRKKAALYQLTKTSGVSGQFRYTQNEASHTEGSQGSGVSGVSKTTPCSNGKKTHYICDQSGRSRTGVEIDTPDTPGECDSCYEDSHSKALSEGVSKSDRYTQDLESEEREVFTI